MASADEPLRTIAFLADMGALVALSSSHFARELRQSTGLSLARLINRRRVRRTLELLQWPTESLASIAHEVGFASQSHFTRVFSRLTGMTPAKYRRQFMRTVG
ncbi:MAG: helix-turn-helix transcriptional regulator [Planctomycetota bacterium]